MLGSSRIDSHWIVDRLKNPVPGWIPDSFCSTNESRNLDAVLESVEDPLRIDPGTFYDVEQNPETVQNPSRIRFLDCFWRVSGLVHTIDSSWMYTQLILDRFKEPRSWIVIQWILFYKRVQESGSCSRICRESIENRSRNFL